MSQVAERQRQIFFVQDEMRKINLSWAAIWSLEIALYCKALYQFEKWQDVKT